MYGIKIDATYNDDEIAITTRYENSVDRAVREIIDLKEKSVREALINLGWTPPETDNV